MLFAWERLEVLYFNIKIGGVNPWPIMAAIPDPWDLIQYIRG
jgi:hypothetical protein